MRPDDPEMITVLAFGAAAAVLLLIGVWLLVSWGRALVFGPFGAGPGRLVAGLLFVAASVLPTVTTYEALKTAAAARGMTAAGLVVLLGVLLRAQVPARRQRR